MGGGPVRYKSFVMDSARWEGFEFRDGDIVISTPPKCGTTWTQMMTALLVFGDPVFDRPLAEISPWLDMLTIKRDDVVASLAAQQHRRFIKSHTPFDGLPYDERVTYVCVGRDPRDAGFSFDNHMANINLGTLINLRAAAVGLDDVADMTPPAPPPDDLMERFWLWVDNDELEAEGSPPGASLWGTLHHLGTFWAARDRPNVVLLHYADLMADLEGEMRAYADRLGITVPEERWPVLVDAARFEQMKSRADVVAPNSSQSLWHDNARFFDKGGVRWRGHLTDDDLVRYDGRVAQLGAPPELVAWAHGGREAVTPAPA